MYNKVRAKKVFFIILGIALVAIFLPVRWTGPLEMICQPSLSPASRLAILAARTVTDRRRETENDTTQLTDEQAERVLALNYYLQELEREYDKLVVLREKVKQTLIPANVVGFDSFGLESVAIDAGSRENVRADAPVLVGLAEGILKLRSKNQRIDARIALASGALIGWIAHSPGPLTARVRLINSSDVLFPVYILHVAEQTGQVAVRAKANVKGAGTKGLIATMVPRNHGVEQGDLVVLAQPEEFKLTVNLAVGKVSKVTVSTDDRQFVDITISPYFKKYDLDYLYVLVCPAEADP